MNNNIGTMDLIIVGFIAAIVWIPLIMGFFEWLGNKIDKWKK
jgi:DMSO/TMAO reductase YedYZ heme-binding membrane subunit